jgi:hypothetical protein
MVDARTYRFGLTADEWLHLAAEGDASEVAPCCGNIGALRDGLNALATMQSDNDRFTVQLVGQQVANAYAWCVGGHDGIQDPAMFPLLHRVLGGLAEHHNVRAPLPFDHDDPDPQAVSRD